MRNYEGLKLVSVELKGFTKGGHKLEYVWKVTKREDPKMTAVFLTWLPLASLFKVCQEEDEQIFVEGQRYHMY